MCFEELAVKQGSLKMVSMNTETRRNYNIYVAQ